MKEDLAKYSFLLGWMLFKPTWLEWLSPLVPQPLFSASSCLAKVRPNYDDWFEEDDKLEFLRLHERNAEGNFIFLDTYEHAQEMNERWFAGEYFPFALALRPAAAKLFDATLERYFTDSNKHNPAFHYDPLEAQAFTGREQLLGYEVLIYDWGWHSYLCNYLEKELFELFQGRLNSNGLISDGDIAERFAKYLQIHDLGEPGLKLAYAFYGMSSPEGKFRN